jgi:hypothetical protein
MVQVRSLVGALAVVGVFGAIEVGAQQPPAAQAPIRTITITVNDPVGEKMEYSVKQIVAKPGERLRIRLVSIAQTPKIVMAHNWVLLKLGTDPKAFSDAAANARANGVVLRAVHPEALPAALYDIVVSNILAQPLIVLAPLLAARTATHGRIALAGILESQAAEVIASYRPWFELQCEDAQESWVLLAGKRM